MDKDMVPPIDGAIANLRALAGEGEYHEGGYEYF